MISKKRAEQLQRNQQKLDAGPISARYPSVVSIVIAMDYYRKGQIPSFLQRRVNFFPGSAAFFLMDCMSDSCIGGFDLEPVIHNMVRGHEKSAKGKLACSGSDFSGHRLIDYKIAIEYNQH
jgi:hypothetical protein